MRVFVWVCGWVCEWVCGLVCVWVCCCVGVGVWVCVTVGVMGLCEGERVVWVGGVAM